MGTDTYSESCANLAGIMSTSSAITLPQALLESSAYKVLTGEQHQRLIEKLNYCQEIAMRAADAARNTASLLAVVDDVEVDALSIASEFAEVTTALPVYLVHASWASEGDRAAMAQYLDPDALVALGSLPVAPSTPGETIRRWLGVWAKALLTTLDRLRQAGSFTEAVTHLVFVDALVCGFLAFAAASRLNCNVFGA